MLVKKQKPRLIALFGLGFLLVILGRFSGFSLLLGIITILSGLIVLAGSSGIIARLMSSRRGRRSEYSALSGRYDPMLAVQILKLAQENYGKLTISKAAMRLNTDLDQVEATFDHLVTKGAARMEIDDSTGLCTFVFPEFLPPPADSAQS